VSARASCSVPSINPKRVSASVRAAVVREALLSAGLVAPEIERLAASVRASDGLPRFVWTDERPDPARYVRTILAAITERQRWREQYRAAVDTVSATAPPPSGEDVHAGISAICNRPRR
jgi:hypothetical protein